MGLFSKRKDNQDSIWTQLNDQNQIDELINNSFEKPIVIFKHSTRCSISIMAKHRIDTNWLNDLNTTLYYIDLLKYRSISNQIQNKFNVPHQSPQILIIKDGKCTYTSSHSEIDVRAIKNEL